MKTPALVVSVFVYTRILRWYPPALRDEFEESMLAVFSEQIEDSWRRGSWRGVLREWKSVMHDLFEVILPYRAACAVPVVLALLVSVTFYGSMLAAIAPSPHCHK